MNQNRCSLETLHKSSAGKVMICRACKNMHLELGNLLAVVSEESFDLIIDEFRERSEQVKLIGPESVGRKKILLQLTSNNLFLTQTHDQFIKTLDLLELSQYYLKVHKILQT
jgi:hypothetical protein